MILSCTPTRIVLDQTVFHPAGGGQPSDSGTITTASNSFTVASVEDDGTSVTHIGEWERDEAPRVGEAVTVSIDVKIRDRAIGIPS
jgi:misacylated tRNA(Ala) deacylase